MGSFSILNNASSLNAQNQLNANNAVLSRSMLRLSSGKRVNSGADDAAGLQIADSLRANTYALNQAARNANDAIGVCQIADGALQETTSLLTRSVTLAEEAATGTVDSQGRASLQAEYRQLNMEIARIATKTNFNGTSIFEWGSGFNGCISTFVGDTTESSTIDVNVDSIATHDAGWFWGSEYSGQTACCHIGDSDYLCLVDLASSQESAADGLATIKSAINVVSNMRGEIGAGMNRLQTSISVLQTQSQNTLAAESYIRDANIAEEVSNMTKCQILSQSGMAALGQANSNTQSVLSLLRG
jgi:flagellin